MLQSGPCLFLAFMKEGGLFGESVCHLDENQQRYFKFDKPLHWFITFILDLR